MSLKKVLWEDGTVVTEAHFFAFEQWVERLVGYTHLHHRYYGLIRDSREDSDFNDVRGITISQIEGALYQVDIEKIKAIDPSGQFIKISDKLTRQFRISGPSNRDYFLYIAPLDTERRPIGQPEDEVFTNVSMYEKGYEITCSVEWEPKVLLCKFSINQGEAIIDQSYIPYGLFIDSCSMCKGRFEKVLEKIREWDHLIEKYNSSVKPENETLPWWIATSHFRKSTVGFLSRMEMLHVPTHRFIEELQCFLSEIQVIFTLLPQHQVDSLKRERLTFAAQALQQRLYQPGEQYINLKDIFDRADTQLKILIERYDDFLNGGSHDTAVEIYRVSFNRGEAGNNRFEIQFAQEVQFNRQKSKIIIKLREFSRQDPGLWNVKVQLGKSIWGQMIELRNILRRIPGERFSYKIECPATQEIVVKDHESYLTMYLPSPLGEGIQDLEKRIIINIEE